MFNEIIRISLREREREREKQSRAPTRIAPKIQIADQVSDVSMVRDFDTIVLQEVIHYYL